MSWMAVCISVVDVPVADVVSDEFKDVIELVNVWSTAETRSSG
jgi:hypothetical protein